METIIDDDLKVYVAQSKDVKRPELLKFTPRKEDGEASLLSYLWLDSSDVPLDPREETRNGKGWTGTMFPSFLLNGLTNSTAKNNASSAYDSIDAASKEGAYFLYGTSGAGKTRSIFEYLSTNKGFYFLCHDFKRNAGSEDLTLALDYFHDFLGMKLRRDEGVENTPALEEQYRNACTPTSEENYRNLQHLVRVLMYIRHSIYCWLHLRFENLTPYEWLLYQLYPEEFLGKDLFADATQAFITSISKDETILKAAAQFTFSSGMMNTEWSIFVDEAQVLLDRGKMCFMSSKTSTRRSSFCALAKAFCALAPKKKKEKGIRFPVFAGTGMSIVELQDEAISISGKKLGMNADEEAQYFTNFALMDPEGVKAYLQCFLNLENVTEAVLSHVCKWLRGRPRWSATFLEVYVMRTKRSDTPNTPDRILLQALECYLNVMTSDPEKPLKKRASWKPGAASAFATFERFMRSEQDTVHMKAVTELSRAMLKFAVGQKPNEFDKDVSQRLIKLGLVAIKTTTENKFYTQGHLDEPIIVEAGLNFMCIDNALLDNYKNQEDGGLGHAFERLILPAFLKDREKFSEVATTMVSDYNHVLPNEYFHGTRSSYGVLALDAQACEDPTSTTLDWIKLSMKAKFEGEVPPFCFPVEAFGPDVIFLLYNEDYSDFRACLVQSKHRKGFSQPDALRTLVPEWLFFNNRDDSTKRQTTLTGPHLKTWDNLKSDLVSNSKPCVRLVVQYPKSKTKSATPGFIAAGVAENRVATEDRAGKRDLLLIVDDKNFNLFGKKIEALASLRKPPNKKQKSSCLA